MSPRNGHLLLTPLTAHAQVNIGPTSGRGWITGASRRPRGALKGVTTPGLATRQRGVPVGCDENEVDKANHQSPQEMTTRPTLVLTTAQNDCEERRT